MSRGNILIDIIVYIHINIIMWEEKGSERNGMRGGSERDERSVE